MKKIIAGVIFPILILSLAGLTSCKDRAVKKEQKKVVEQQAKKFENQIETNVYPIPNSATVIQMLQKLEVGYQYGLTNPPQNTKKYFDNPKRAVNLGVFGADLSYATLYNKLQEVNDYLSAMGSLANELNMSKIYDTELYNRINQNRDNKDTLVKILTTSFNDTYAYLSENDQTPQALLVVGGAWVEGMYLTTKVSDAAYQFAGISKVLLEQKKSFEDYLEITKTYEKDASVSDFVKNLDPVKKVYEGLSTSLTEQNIIDIGKAIDGIRAKIVE